MKAKLLGLAIAASLAASTLGMASARAADDATLNVVHGIPGVDVNVCVNGTEAIPDFTYGQVVTGVALSAGSYDIKIVAADANCDAAAILEANGVELAAGKNYTAIANLDGSGSPTISLFTNNVKPVTQGKARLTVRHTAAAPAVDVWANGSKLLTGVPYGASATMTVAKGVYAVWASAPGDYEPVIGANVYKLKKGNGYQVYAIGNNTDNYTFAVVAIPVGTK